MTLKEVLKECGGVGASVKVGFESSFVYCGALCSYYESLFRLMYRRDMARVKELFDNNKKHYENFDAYWAEVREREISQKKHDLDYPLCCAEKKEFIEKQKEIIGKINENIKNYRRSISKAETSESRKYLYSRIQMCDRERMTRLNTIRGAENYIKEYDGKSLSDEDIEDAIQKLEKELDLRQEKDFAKTLNNIERYSAELAKLPYLERDVLDVYDSVSPDEPGTKIIIVDGIKGGAYWTCGEMAKDKVMQRMIERVGDEYAAYV